MVRRLRSPRRCQTQGCRGLACRAETIELPDSWDGAGQYLSLLLTVGLCRTCGRSVAERVAAMLQGRAQLVELREHLVEAEGALAYERELSGAAAAELKRERERSRVGRCEPAAS